MENVRAISVIASFVDQKSNSSMYKIFIKYFVLVDSVKKLLLMNNVIIYLLVWLKKKIKTTTVPLCIVFEQKQVVK